MGIAENPLKITDVTLRDGHQSLFATRMRTEDMESIAEEMNQAGFYSMEVWGGTRTGCVLVEVGSTGVISTINLFRYCKI